MYSQYATVAATAASLNPGTLAPMLPLAHALASRASWKAPAFARATACTAAVIDGKYGGQYALSSVSPPTSKPSGNGTGGLRCRMDITEETSRPAPRYWLA